MKKVIVIFFIFFVVAVCSMNTAFFDYLTGIEDDADISFYCITQQKNLEDWEETKNGEGYIYTTKIKNFNYFNKKINNFYGFSIKFFNKNNLNEILSKINISKIENIENKTIFYGIANGLCFSNFVNLQKVNVQVAKCEDCFVVGSPLIFGSY